MTKTKTISRTQDGGNSNEKSGAGEKVKVKERGAAMKMGGVKDPLRGALGGGPKKSTSSQHKISPSKTPAAGGAHYSPAQEFGSIHGPQSPATSMTIHFSNPGQNALGDVMNRVGLNALPGAHAPGRGTFRGNP